MPYSATPRYPVVGGEIARGHAALAAAIASERPRVLAIDGPAAADWDTFIGALTAALGARAITPRLFDTRDKFADWAEIVRRTESPKLRDDPVFARVPTMTIDALFGTPGIAVPQDDAAMTVVYGPGSALARHDRLWYADLPKARALRAIERGRARNLGQPRGDAGSARRLLFIDWPIEDRHRRALASRWTRYLDVSEPRDPRSVGAETLSRSLRALREQPFRTRPTFLAQPWGGRWLREVLHADDGPQGGLGYELIAPESGIPFGPDGELEVALDVLIADDPSALLGAHVLERFGPVLPIRFDYLDTVGGGDLSVHCHPQEGYMRDVFGLAYTQHETYYVMVTRDGARIFLGLQDGVELARFREAAESSRERNEPFDIERFVPAVPARRHQLYLIPGGTPHGSGEGNVVLEISATPYLYSLRFYDWMRERIGGGLRPVQLEHAFANLAPERKGEARRRLVPEPTLIRREGGGAEFDLGRHPDLFFAVRRLEIEKAIHDATDGRFHVLNLVEGDEVVVRTEAGREHALSYAETLVVPAGVGRYEIVRERGDAAKVVKAFVT
jgi:mannose-6-phosphate isomerase class I